MIARRLARDLGYRVSGEVFVGALLHDMGISVLHEHFHDEYKRIVEIAGTTELTWCEAEESVLGVSHAAIGGWLAERWNFPPALVEAVAKHHSPLDAKDNPELVGIIHCADVFAHRLGAETMIFDKGLDFNPEVLQRLNLNDPVAMDEYLATYRKNIQTDVEEFASLSSAVKEQ